MENKNKNSIRFVQMNSYTSPIVKEVKSKDWVEYGDNNLYFEHLIDRYNGSPTNNACINGISQMIFGRGIDAIDASLKDYTEFKMLIKDEDVEKISSDLKLLGNAAIQVVYNIDHTKILEVEHFPVQTLRAGKANEDGVIEHYYYFHDWSKLKRTDKPEPICAFGTSNSGCEILYIKPYKAGFYYYSPPDYQGGLQYAELEEEISNYHLNNILNGLAPSMLINFNNGIPDEDMQATIEADVQRKYGGTSNAGRFILAFNDKPEEKATLEAVQLSDAHNQYQFLSDESMRKIMVAHRVVSPMLLGIKDNSGLGNNAEELKTGSILMDNVVVRPFQDLIIKNIDKILSFNKVNVKLYFKTLQPLEFVDLENATTKEQIVEETGQNFSKVSDSMYSEILAQLDGESIDLNEWELVTESEAGEDEYIYNTICNNSFKFAAQIQPTAGSSWQDNDLFKIRYSYAGSTAPEREFCKLMMSNGLFYRYEDLDKDTNYNPGFGPRGTVAYNIWLYKGGANCKHYWMRSIFLKKNNGKISVNQAREIINNIEPSERAKYRLPVNDPKVAKLPYDMPNHGYLNPR
jgi:hypothetical protein